MTTADGGDATPPRDAPGTRGMTTADGGDATPPRDARGTRWVTPLLLLLGLVGAAAWILAYEPEVDQIEQAFDYPLWIALGIASLTLPMLLHTVRYHLLLRYFATVESGFVLNIVLACTFLNHFVVAKIGDFAEPVWLQRRYGMTYWLGLQVGLVRFAHSCAGLALLVTLTLVVWAPFLEAPFQPLAAWPPLLVTLGSITLALLALPALSERLGQKDGASSRFSLSVTPSTREASPELSTDDQQVAGGIVRKIVGKAQAGLIDLIHAASQVPARAHIFFILLAFVELGVDGIPFVFFVKAAGAELGLAPTLTAATSLNVIEYLPTPPAMLGVQSWVSTVSLLTSNIPTATLAVSVALHRTLRTLVIGLVGAYPLARLARDRLEHFQPDS